MSMTDFRDFVLNCFGKHTESKVICQTAAEMASGLSLNKLQAGFDRIAIVHYLQMSGDTDPAGIGPQDVIIEEWVREEMQNVFVSHR